VEIGSFMAPGSLLYAGPNRQTLINMTTILDGTADLRLVFTISQGSLVLDDSTHLTAQLGLGYYGTFATGDDLNIMSVGLAKHLPQPVTHFTDNFKHEGLDGWVPVEGHWGGVRTG
jgi:hypothetical protein